MIDESSSDPSGPAARGSKLARAAAASSAVTVFSGCSVFFRILKTLRVLYLLAPGLGLEEEVSLVKNALIRPDLVGVSDTLSSSSSKSLCNSSDCDILTIEQCNGYLIRVIVPILELSILYQKSNIASPPVDAIQSVFNKRGKVG